MPLAMDAPDHNGDWTKQTWDLQIDSKDQLLSWLAAIGQTVAWFKGLTVYKMNVDKMPWLQEL